MQTKTHKVVIRSIDIMTLKIVVVSKALNFVWMLTKVLTCPWFTNKRQSSHIKSSHIARLGKN